MSPWGADKPWHPFEPAAWSQLVAIFPYTEVLFEPGTQYRYSNPGSICSAGSGAFAGRRCSFLNAAIAVRR